MAKVSLIFAVAFVAAVATTGQKENSHAFVKLFNDLHKEPHGHQRAPREGIQTLWITQPLDHFNASERRMWQMRYMANDKFFKPGGPLFIFVGGEWSISGDAISERRLIYDMARENNGYLFYTEHRFYGESKPVADLSTPNLKYLNVKQALGDLAYFIKNMRASIPGMHDSKAVLVGCSYSGTMVAWFNKMYPYLTAGSWASSAPLLAVHNFYQYEEIVGQSIRLMGGDACYKSIENGFHALELMLENKRAEEVKAMLRMCNSFDENDDRDVFTMFFEISRLFSDLVQNHDAGDIEKACGIIMQGPSDVVGLANYIVQRFAPTDCMDFSYNTYLATHRDTAYSENLMRRWIYQSCNEFGWFQTSNSWFQPFGSKHPLQFFNNLCADIYGEEFTHEYIAQRVAQTNREFGSIVMLPGNVYYTNGELDPWKEVGIAIYDVPNIIPHYSHCKDLNSIQFSDSPEMQASKHGISNLVREWLA